MKKALILLGVAGLIALVVTLSVSQATRKGTKVYEEEARKVGMLVSTVKASGEIQPKVYVNISSQVPGQIVELRVKEGDRMRRGEILLQLDPEQYRAAVTRLEANLRLARINLDREKNSLATHESTLRRQEALARGEIVSAEMLDQTRLLYNSSRIQLKALEEQIRQAEADLVKSRDEYAKTTIRAPIHGLVTRVNAKLGEQVIIGTMNNPGTVILVLSDMSEMLAEVRVDETEVASVRPGQKAIVTVDALEDRRFEGTVTEISHTAIKERDVSRFTVKVSLSREAGAGGSPAARELPPPEEAEPGLNAAAALRPGMTAHAALQVASRQEALVVPLQAVIGRRRSEVEEALGKTPGTKSGAGGPGAGDERAGSPAGSIAAEESAGRSGGKARKSGADSGEEMDVIFVDRDGKVEMLPVHTGLSDEFNVELLESPLEPGDKVVVGPYRTLKKLKHGEAVVSVEKDEELKEQE